MGVSTRRIVEGPAYGIYEIVSNGQSYVEEFIIGLPEEMRNRLDRLIERIAVEGKPRNEQKFRLEEDGIFAIKQVQVRIYCFF